MIPAGSVLGASMRPGQAAPDESPGTNVPVPASAASMRPGQAAPDEDRPMPAGAQPATCFNEAGASSPG